METRTQAWTLWTRSSDKPDLHVSDGQNVIYWSSEHEKPHVCQHGRQTSLVTALRRDEKVRLCVRNSETQSETQWKVRYLFYGSHLTAMSATAVVWWVCPAAEEGRLISLINKGRQLAWALMATRTEQTLKTLPACSTSHRSYFQCHTFNDFGVFLFPRLRFVSACWGESWWSWRRYSVSLDTHASVHLNTQNCACASNSCRVKVKLLVLTLTLIVFQENAF